MHNSKKSTSILKTLFDNRQRNFYFLLAFSLIAILFTHPFLRFPYDIIQHLIYIDHFYERTVIPEGRVIWHFFWAKLFYFFSIPNSEVFLRAKIIHIVQTFIAFFSVFIFSKVVIRNIFLEIDKIILNYLSLWSGIIWFSIFATFSIYYQQVWNLWYSVNYQITLPLFWYITALTLILFSEKTSIRKKVFFTLQILLISRIILQVHSMEFLYYLMYILIFGLIYLDKVYYFLKQYFYIAIPTVLAIVYFTKKYQPEKSKIFNYLEIDKLAFLYHDIMTQGQILVGGGLNRASASINELMIVIFYLSIILVLLIIVRKILLNKTQFIDIKIFTFFIITSMFVLIPLYKFSAGIFAIITYTAVVNRLYYSSSLFVILPVFIYYILYIKDKKNISIIKINLLFLLILSSVWLYSKYYTVDQTYYKNVKSIKNSFFERRVGFNLTSEQIDLIGEKIASYEKENDTDKEIYYFAREDIAFVIKYIYRKNVLWEGRRVKQKYLKKYKEAMKMRMRKNNNNRYNLVLFEVPEGFPEYTQFK